jgi:predicted transcriptional regulator
MKRITIVLDDEIHARLIDYARVRSRQNFLPSNLSSAVRKLLAERLGELGYYTLVDNKKTTMPLAKEEGTTSAEMFEKGTLSSLKSHYDLPYSFSIKGTKPVYITCKANLSWTIMEDYLRSLESLGFVRSSASEEKRKIYQLSETAFGMLKQYLRVEN